MPKYLTHMYMRVYRKAVLPIKSEPRPMETDCEDTCSDLNEYTTNMNQLRDGLFVDAKGNIKSAQARMKKDYDRKNG